MVVKEGMEGITAVGTAAVNSMASTPLAIALLVVNIGFLSFAAYVLGEVASNASERNKIQQELIMKLVTDIRDCRSGPRSEVPEPWLQHTENKP
jgi:hypothetical protein